MNLNIGAILFLVFMLQSAGGGAANSQQLTKILMFLGFMYFAFKTLLPMLFDVLLAYTQQSPTKVMEITLPVSEYEYLIKNQQTMLLEDDGEDEEEEEVETKLATDIQTALDTALRSIPGLQIISSDVVFPGDSKSATVMLKKTKKPLVASSPAPLPVPAPIVVVQPVPAVAPSPIVVAQPVPAPSPIVVAPAPIVAPASIVVSQPTTAPVLTLPVVQSDN